MLLVDDPVLIVGSITAQERHICVRNRFNGTCLVHLVRHIWIDMKFDFGNLIGEIDLHAGKQLYLTVCEEDSIYTIRAKFSGFYSENNSEYMIWRKNESTVSHSFSFRSGIHDVFCDEQLKHWSYFMYFR